MQRTEYFISWVQCIAPGTKEQGGDFCLQALRDASTNGWQATTVTRLLAASTDWLLLQSAHDCPMVALAS